MADAVVMAYIDEDIALRAIGSESSMKKLFGYGLKGNLEEHFKSCGKAYNKILQELSKHKFNEKKALKLIDEGVSITRVNQLRELSKAMDNEIPVYDGLDEEFYEQLLKYNRILNPFIGYDGVNMVKNLILENAIVPASTLNQVLALQRCLNSLPYDVSALVSNVEGVIYYYREFVRFYMDYFEYVSVRFL